MYIGHLIKQKVEEQGRSVTWLARGLSNSRTNVYNIYEKKSIDADLLLRISVLLDYDFFADYSREFEENSIVK